MKRWRRGQRVAHQRAPTQTRVGAPVCGQLSRSFCRGCNLSIMRFEEKFQVSNQHVSNSFIPDGSSMVSLKWSFGQSVHSWKRATWVASVPYVVLRRSLSRWCSAGGAGDTRLPRHPRVLTSRGSHARPKIRLIACSPRRAALQTTHPPM